MSSIVLKGSCFCGKVEYTAATPPVSVTNCHCKTCQKLSGGPFMTFAGFKTKDVKFSNEGAETKVTSSSEGTSGALDIFSLSDKAIRGACRLCHSHMFMLYHASPDTIFTTVGSIDEQSLSAEDLDMLKPSHHIFGLEKASWYDMAKDDIPCYERFSDSDTI